MALTYYVQFDCPDCDDSLFYGPCMSLLEHRGYPVVMADEGAQTQVDCDSCGARVYTGDLDVYSEGGSDGEDGEGP